MDEKIRHGFTGAILTLGALMASNATAAPKVVLISLDGATPRMIEQYLASGDLSATQGIGLLKSKGAYALRNITVTPSLTAAGHIAIATGSIASANDINSNTLHLAASPFLQNVSGFSAPIGGYSIDGPAESESVTASPLWIGLRAAGKIVAAATFPGADGLDIRVPGAASNAIVQPASKRTVDYTVPFGAFAGLSARAFTLSAADFSAALPLTISQLTEAGRRSFSPVLRKTTALENFTVGGVDYALQVAALDTTDDGAVDYDTLVFFDSANGVQPGPFRLPSTGPAYVRASDRRSSPFYLEGSASKAGIGFYVGSLAPDLSTVHIARYSANAIPRGAASLADVDDINDHVGFWGDQADYRILDRLSPGFSSLPDSELEAIYEDQIKTFLDYQTRVALRAVERNPAADLVMIYLEQPDGSEHQFLLTDPRQATDSRNPATIGAGQDPVKVARYAEYVKTAYQAADRSVQRVIDAVGVGADGRPKSDILVVSDHGFDPFHTTVDINALLNVNGIDPSKARAVASGPAVNIYFNLQGREPDGVVSKTEFLALRRRVKNILKSLKDTNSNYTNGAGGVSVFDKIFARPANLKDEPFGRRTSEFIGQDSGDIFALLRTGYNFDGSQNPIAPRLGDTPSSALFFSTPSFYGAHGYDPNNPHMSAVFYAAGPDIEHRTIKTIHNIDIAPTIDALLGVRPAATVQGRPIPLRRSSRRL